MAKQYWVGDYFVDLSRNQITKDDQSQTMAPKALAVLTCLAENRGQVVSQDALLDKVWHDAAVTPNTLQRSIAQLRKALGDDAKAQQYIKTHAKQGYSLECDVRWEKVAELKHNVSQPEPVVVKATVPVVKSNDVIKSTPVSSRFTIIPAFTIFGVIVLILIGPRVLQTQEPAAITFDTLRSLTATDDREFGAIYSPDGQYIVFHRYLEMFCVNRIWAKHIETQQEFLLTSEWGSYDSLSFSPDGKRLVFLSSQDCDDLFCFNLMSLGFEKALREAQQPSLMLQCKNSEIRKPIWIGSDQIALMQRKSDRWKLISYSVRHNDSRELYNPEEGDLIHFAYSVKDDLIAAIRVHPDSQHYIDIIATNGDLLSSHAIERPPEFPKYRPIYPTFDPQNEQLIFSTGRQLFTLSYTGKVAKIPIPSAERMMEPVFHPNGQKVLMIKGPYDSDIVKVPLTEVTEANTSAQHSFERSNQGEDYAMFQPGGDLIAYWSERSGVQQIWISDGESSHQLTDFPLDTKIGGFDWAADGQSLLINANYVLTQVFLDSSQKVFELGHAVDQLFQWDSEHQTALLRVRINGLRKFVVFDLNSLELQEITGGNVQWALKSEDGRLIYKDFQDRFWQPGPVEDQLIEPLNEQGNRASSFVMKGNVIYAINKSDHMWSYNLDSEAFNTFGTVDKNVDYLTDVNQTHLLLSLRVAAKKEVVELSLND
jgi:DNA-binding winged helix-turn-helix (wHTH) protein